MRQNLWPNALAKLCGAALGLRSLISYEGDTIDELLENFREAVDNYLAVCEEVCINPERAYEA